MDFTNYLRQNFNAIASEDPVPFADELKHTQSYLAVEKAQHEKNLFVEYDTPVTRFRLPSLTLQPLVENAVKHGMDPNAGPLTISIRTEQTGAGVYTYNLGTGTGYSVLDMVKAFSEVLGRQLPYKIVDRRPGDIDACYADPTKAKEELGFVAQYDLKKMCADSWNFQQKIGAK